MPQPSAYGAPVGTSLGRRGMRFFIFDQLLLPQLAIRLNRSDRHEAIHPLHSCGARAAPSLVRIKEALGG